MQIFFMETVKWKWHNPNKQIKIKYQFIQIIENPSWKLNCSLFDILSVLEPDFGFGSRRLCKQKGDFPAKVPNLSRITMRERENRSDLKEGVKRIGSPLLENCQDLLTLDPICKLYLFPKSTPLTTHQLTLPYIYFFISWLHLKNIYRYVFFFIGLSLCTVNIKTYAKVPSNNHDKN